MLSMHRPLPSMLIMIPWSFRVPVKSSLVNWLPWSVLKISGGPYRESASSSASRDEGLCLPFTRTREAQVEEVVGRTMTNLVENAAVAVPAEKPRRAHRATGKPHGG